MPLIVQGGITPCCCQGPSSVDFSVDTVQLNRKVIQLGDKLDKSEKLQKQIKAQLKDMEEKVDLILSSLNQNASWKVCSS